MQTTNIVIMISLLGIFTVVYPMAFADDHGIPEQVTNSTQPITDILPEPEPVSTRDLQIESLQNRTKDLRLTNIELRKEIRELNGTINYLNDQIFLITKELAYSFMQLNEWYRLQIAAN